MLYAATTREIPRRPFQKDAPDLNVVPLRERDSPIKMHFKNPEVQRIGSTSGCGCDFPHVTLHPGDWIDVALAQERDKSNSDKDRVTTVNSNRSALVNLLNTTGEPVIELYGIWDGDFLETPMASEVISLDQIIDSNFYFKERGFYRVEISPNEDSNDSR